jgi:hypothetical protein
MWVLLALFGCSTNTRDVDEVARDQPAVSEGDQVSAGAETPAATGNTVNAAGLTMTIPEGWVKEVPSSQMRAAQLSLPSLQSGVENGEITIFHFGPGGGGGIQDNIVRWANQFPQEDGADPMSRAKIEEFNVGQLKVSTIDLVGRYKVSGMGTREYDEAGWMLLGAIVEGSGGPWFIKGVGPEQVMESNRDEFLSFVKSAQL